MIIYEGHDIPKTRDVHDPKTVDQPEVQPKGGLTQNGLFMAAAQRYKEGKQAPERVRVFEKIRNGIWVYNGLFDLVDGWRETVGKRTVFKFKLQLIDEPTVILERENGHLAEHDRVIPTAVKLEVWKRDKGSCVKCGNKQNLHFDHIIPYSLGGSSKDATNIQILCGKHNIAKRDKIE